MRNRGLLIALGLLAAGGCLWWMGSSRRSQGSFPDAPVPASADSMEPAALLAEPARPEPEFVADARTVPEERTIVEPDPELVASAVASTQSPSAEGTLIVRILRSDTGAAMPGERVALRRVNDTRGVQLVAGSIGGSGDAPSSDEDGRCTFRIPAGEPGLLLSMRAFGRSDRGHLDIEPLKPGEAREIDLVIPVFNHWIRVEGAEDGIKIAGACAREEDGDQEAHTGLDGLAMLWCSEWRDEQIDVEAEGYGPARIELRHGHEQPADALIVQLFRGASLRGRVLGAKEEPIPRAQVRVLADGQDLSPAESTNLWEGGTVMHSYGPDRTWSAQTDDTGAFELRGLPPSIPLHVTASKGARLRLKVPEPVELKPGQELEVVYRLGAGAVVRGVVLDGTRQPVPRCRLWLKNAREDFAEDFPAPERRLRSDKEGVFEIQDVPDGKWSIGPALNSGYLPTPTDVQVLEGACAEVVVEARPASFVAGRVLGPLDAPVFGAHVYGGGRTTRCSADGAFSLGPFAPGPVTLDVNHSELIALEPFHVQAGEENVVLRLVAGGRFAGRLVDAVTGEPAAGVVTLSRDRSTRFHEVGPTGEFAFQGLDPGIYGMAARSPDGAVGFLESISIGEPGGGRDDLVVRLAPGGRLSLRFPPGEEYTAYRVRKGASVFVEDAAGSEEVVTPSLPAGDVVVELLPGRSLPLLSRDATVQAGETVLVDLSKEH